MELQSEKKQKLYQLSPKQGPVFPLSIGRFLVGQAESCEVLLLDGSVSPIHAVIEVTSSSIKVYDMSSKTGTFVNGNKALVSELSLGDVVKIGNVELQFEKFQTTPTLPPVLESLDPHAGKAKLPPSTPAAINETNKNALTAKEFKKLVSTPTITYPLELDPKAEFSEYIFEDAKEVYPIFKYEVDRGAVEVIILFEDKVYSVDFLPEQKGIYKISGLTNKDDEIEFPYLAKEEESAFIEVNSGNCLVHKLHNFDVIHLSDNPSTGKEIINLIDDDIVKLHNKELEIYVRRVPSPPKIKAPPFFRRDPSFKKYILLAVLLFSFVFAALTLYKVDPEKEKEKTPERIATILYKKKLSIKKKKAVAKTPKKKKKIQKTKAKKKTTETKKKTVKKKMVVKKPDVKPTPKKAAGIRKAPSKKPVKKAQVKSKTNNKVVKQKKAPIRKKVGVQKSRTARSAVKLKTTGPVQAYKSFNFKSTINTNLAKGGTRSGIKTRSSRNFSDTANTSIGGGVSSKIQNAGLNTQVGSISNSSSNRLGTSRGAQGLGAKKDIVTAGFTETIVEMGSMDPDDIRRILRENLGLFTSCYQRELDNNPGRKISGQTRFRFQISPLGTVRRAGIEGNIPARVKSCCKRVLEGLQFPRPLGGGVVDVNQPFNFNSGRL